MKRTLESPANKTLALVFSILAFVSVAIAILAPADRGASNITWSSESDPNPAILSIADPIESLELSAFSAPELINEPIVFDGAYFSTDAREQEVASLRVVVDVNGVTATLISPRGELKEIVGPLQVGGGTGGFPSEWAASVIDRELRLTTNQETLTAPLPTTAWFQLGIESGWAQVSGTEGFNVTYTVTMSGGSLRAPGLLHALAIWTSIPLIVITVFLLWQSTGVKIVETLRLLRWRRIDVVFAVAVVVFAFIAPVAFDDGWELTWGRELVNSPWGPSAPFMSFPGEPFQNPQGFLYYSLLGVTAGQTTSVIGMRSLSVLMLFSLWMIVSRILVPRLFPASHKNLIVPAASLMMLFSYSWMTLRSEVPVALLTALFFAIALSKSEGSRALRIVGYSAVAGAALSIHPNGMILLFPWVIFVVRDLRSRGVTPLDKVTGLIAGAAIGLLFIFFNLTLSLLLEFLAEYPTSPLDLFNEWGRFSGIFEIGSFAQRAWFLGAIIGLVSLWVYTISQLLSVRPSGDRVWALVALSLMPLGLAISTSKLPWHYASLELPFLIGLLLAINYVATSSRRRTLGGLTVVGTVAWLALAAKDANIPVTWIGLENDNLQIPPLWIALTLTVATLLSMLIASYRRIRSTTMLGMQIGLVTTIVTGVTLTAAIEVSRASTSGWSFLKQSTLGLVNSDLRCGLANYIPVGSTDGPSASEAIRESGFTARVPLYMTLQSPCVPPAGRVQGSWNPAVGSSIYERFGGRTDWSVLNESQLRSGCVELATLNERSHEVCFLENYPPQTPVLFAERVEYP